MNKNKATITGKKPEGQTSRLAEYRSQNGRLTLFAAGRPILPLMADLTPETSDAHIVECTGAGIRLFRITGVDLGWQGIGQFDYAPLESRLHILSNSAPDAFFFLVVHLDAPDWWRQEHMEECAGFLHNREENQGRYVSWASQRWRSEAGSALTRLVRHIQSSPWGGRCLGWQLAAGAEGEWRHDRAEDLPDAGPRMTEQFRLWAVEKYRRNTGLLRKAWFDTRAEFDRITCPDARERQRGDYGVLRNPRRSQRILDYFECFFDAQNTTALHFCAQVKRASGGNALVGLSYATAFENGAVPEDGHGFPEPVLDSSDVDFIANRGAADGSFPRALPGSLDLRGKFLFHGTPAKGDVQKTAALALTQQCGLIVPATASSETLKAISAALERASSLSAKVRKRTSPLAVIADMANRHYIAESAEQPNALNHTLLTSQIKELTRIGAPFDLYLLSDLFHPKFPDYTLFLFLNTFYLSETERRRVDARVKRSEQTAIWLWGAGLIGEEGVSAEYGHRLCGQKLRLESAGISLRVRIAEANDPLTWGQHMGSHFGPERPIIPTVTVGDKKTTRLGANTDNKTVFAVQRNEQWTSLLFGTSLAPSNLLRNVLRANGSHLYSDANEHGVVFADSRSVGVTSERGGTARISLPGQYDVIDAWTNKIIAQNVSEFTAALAPGGTGYYELRKRGVEEKKER